jgi:integrase
MSHSQLWLCSVYAWGLRISEALALRWDDVEWLGSRLSIRCGIVEQVVDDVKTEGSAKPLNLTSELLERLKSCEQRSEFSGAEDWIFASPMKLAGLPYSYTGVWRELKQAATAAKIAPPSDTLFPTHSPLMA